MQQKRETSAKTHIEKSEPYYVNTRLQWFILCRRSMGSLLRWLKSSSTKVKNLPDFNWEWFLLCGYIHIAMIFNLQTARDRNLPNQTTRLSSPLFSSPFSCCSSLWFKLHFGKSCNSSAATYGNKTENGEFRFLERNYWSVFLKNMVWYWWSEAFVKPSVLVCFSVTCKEVCFILLSADTLCFKGKRPL